MTTTTLATVITPRAALLATLACSAAYAFFGSVVIIGWLTARKGRP